MALFTKRSLLELRERVDLCEVISSYVSLKKTGGTYKGLCPFHNEKSPSFLIQRGDSHYHCFGCGAHGDAVGFLMNFLKVTFREAVETLAGRFGVTLEYEQQDLSRKEPDTAPLKGALQAAKEFFHFHLLHTQEGKQALQYLYQRGLNQEFIEMFSIGLSPKNESLSLEFFQQAKLRREVLIESGLAKENRAGKLYPFFSSRIMFPIEDISGNVIGFSGRLIDPATRGGKYVNTPETPLFKKSKVLFGLNYSRKRIAKEQKAIIVEGQIDALRLIQAGLNLTVAGQGTAFGSGHVDALKRLGMTHAYLAFDGDEAGQTASVKVGQLFQKVGIEVTVIQFPEQEDPDGILTKQGLEVLLQTLKGGKPYIEFLVEFLANKTKMKTPAGKNRVALEVAAMIEEWEHPLMVHEGFKVLAQILQVPETILHRSKVVAPSSPASSMPPPKTTINVDKVLETDLIRWLFLVKAEDGDMLTKIVEDNLSEEGFRDPVCRKLFSPLLSFVKAKKSMDIFDISELLSKEEEMIIDQIVKKRVNTERAKEGVCLAIEKILERNWMLERERIKRMIQKGEGSEEQILDLAKKFDELKKMKPKVSV